MSVKLIQLENTPIYKQLQIEEALLRSSKENYCLINIGSIPSIIMGISAKVEQVIHSESVIEKKIPLVRRFSGGGTVIVDHNTIFVSFIFQKNLLNIPLYPEPILRWTEEFYQDALSIEGFCLKENDYVIKEHKCAGNAQYIQKDRFVHHSTFLWDFCNEQMNHLKFPPKTPQYRESRSHGDFLCRLKNYFQKNTFAESVKTELKNRFKIINYNLEEIEQILTESHRKSTQFICLNNNR